MKGYILRYKPGGPTELIDMETDEPVAQPIRSLKFEADATDAPPQLIVELCNTGLEIELAAADVKFNTRHQLTFTSVECIALVSALRALKVISVGGDTRTAMLQAVGVFNAGNEKLISGDGIEQLILRLTPPAKGAESQENFEDVERPVATPKVVSKPEAVSLTEGPKVVEGKPAGEGDDFDPVKGKAIVPAEQGGTHGNSNVHPGIKD